MVIWLMLQNCSLSLREVGAVAQVGAEAGAAEGCLLVLACFPWLADYCCSAQVHLPRDGTAYSGLDPP